MQITDMYFQPKDPFEQEMIHFKLLPAHLMLGYFQVGTANLSGHDFKKSSKWSKSVMHKSISMQHIWFPSSYPKNAFLYIKYSDAPIDFKFNFMRLL